MIHYIPDTNEKYSITEDGVVTMHYRIGKSNNKIECNKKLKEYKMRRRDNLPIVKINQVSRSVSSLVYLVFNFTRCEDCNCKVEKGQRKRICKNCFTIAEKKRAHTSVIEIKKHYSAKMLGLSVKELTDELYLSHKLNLKSIRLIKSKSNESNSLQSVK